VHFAHTGVNVNSSTDDLTDRVASLAPVLRAVHVVRVRARTETVEHQAAVLMHHSDFRYGHRSRPVL